MFVDSDDWIGTDCCKTLLSHTNKQTDVCLFSYIREFANQSFPQYLFSDKRWFIKDLQSTGSMRDL